MLSFDPYAMMSDGNVSIRVGVFFKVNFSGILPSGHNCSFHGVTLKQMQLGAFYVCLTGLLHTEMLV